MRARVALCVLASTLGGALLPARAHAEPFRYFDRNGRVHELVAAVSEEPEPVIQEDFPYAEIVREAAIATAVPVELIRAVMHVESAEQPHAVSSVGARGLMQLMPSTAGDLGVTDAFDPRQNILGGARQLRFLMNTFNGDLALTIAAYHAGATAIRRAGGTPPSKVTRRYVIDVLALYHRLLSHPPVVRP